MNVNKFKLKIHLLQTKHFSQVNIDEMGRPKLNMFHTWVFVIVF
jgi:hypothetical protein